MNYKDDKITVDLTDKNIAIRHRPSLNENLVICCKPPHNRTHDPLWETFSPHLAILASMTKRLSHDQRDVGKFQDSLGRRPNEELPNGIDRGGSKPYGGRKPNILLSPLSENNKRSEVNFPKLYSGTIYVGPDERQSENLEVPKCYMCSASGAPLGPQTEYPHQSGFTTGRSTTDAILALRLLSELHWEFNRPLHVAYVDLKSTFDPVDRKAL